MPDYLPYLDALADDYGVPRAQARAIYQLETSSGRNVRPSSAGAQGQMQLMPATARELGVTDINDPYQNLRGGVKYYAQQLRRFRDPAVAAAAYNAGPGRVQRAGGVPQIRETQDYVSNFRRMIGAKAPVTPRPTSAIVATPAAPQGTAAQGQSTMDEPEDMTGALVAATQPDELVGIAQEAQQLIQRRQQLRRQQFEEGQRRIQAQYGAPSRSDTLLALSQALLAPRPYRGFAGTMHNITEALGGISERAKLAEQGRNEALARLQQSYQTGSFEDEDAALQMRYNVAKDRAATQAAAAKAAQPRVELDAQGRLRAVPKQIFRPKSRAEYDAIPVGEFYQVPDGPQAGQIVAKTAGGN